MATAVNKNIITTIGVLLIATAAVGYYFYTQSSVESNADYICTREITLTDTQCLNGSWSDYEEISKTSAGESVWQRVYSGFRATKKVIKYGNLRTNCGEGYTQRVAGNKGGTSGFHGGDITLYGTACEIRETYTAPALTASSTDDSLIGADPNDMSESDLASRLQIEKNDLNNTQQLEKRKITTNDFSTIDLSTVAMECSLDGKNYSLCSEGFVELAHPDSLYLRIPDEISTGYQITSSTWSALRMSSLNQNNLGFGEMYAKEVTVNGVNKGKLNLQFGTGKQFELEVELVVQSDKNLLGKGSFAQGRLQETIPMRILNVDLQEQ